jgi:hypothetical protein
MIRFQGMGWAASGRGTRRNEPMASSTFDIKSASNERSWEGYTLNEKGASSLEKRRVEFESVAGGDHDIPDSFALPECVPEVLT